MIEDPDFVSLMRKIRELREGNQQIPFAELGKYIDLSEAYKEVSVVVGDGTDVGAWKLGGTNKQTQEVFNVNQPYFGPIYKSEMYTVGSLGNFPNLPLLEGEAELALRLTNFGASKKHASNRDSSLIFDQWAVGVEFPCSVFSDLPSAGVAALIADRCAAGALVLGLGQSGLPPKEFHVSLFVDGELASSGNQDTLLFHPVDAALAFRELAFDQDIKLNAGQWISTGGVTSCLKLNKASELILKLDDKEILKLVNR